ncbi:MAG: SpoIIIAH-like family protein [Clostridia bacterium]|nr:SpoIIIAH-like family protein [Clostridia bacterium]
MSKTKKIVVIVSMVLVLAVAAVLNVYLLDSTNQTGNDENSVATFFETSRADRQATRAYEIQQLNDILAMEGEEYAEARANALQQKMSLVEAIELELKLETMLKAQGFADTIVTVSTTSDNINVIVDSDNLTREDTARIYSVIIQEASISPDYVNIVAI